MIEPGGSEDSEHVLASMKQGSYDQTMIIIRFHDPASERKALGYLAGRFSFKSWSNGATAVPEAALPNLAREGIRFVVEGPASYERLLPTFRNVSATAV